MSYVTGSHAFKFGFNRTHGYLDEYQYTLNPVSYRFNNGVPNQITERALPYPRDHQPRQRPRALCAGPLVGRSLDDAGGAPLRLLRDQLPGADLGPAPLTPNRNITFPAQDNISWKDLTYRSGFAYDLFGTGKTALKVAFNKYLLGQTLNGLGRDPNPVDAGHPGEPAVEPLVGRASIATTSRSAISLNPLANGECAQLDNLAFGTAVAERRVRQGSDLGVQSPPGQLGVLGRRAARADAGHRARRGLLPPRLGAFPRDRQPAGRPGGLHRSSASWRRPIRACRAAAATR